MTMKANESFSAFLDGEASELDIQRMMKALDDQPELMTSWHELSKASALVQGDVVVDTALQRPSLEHTAAEPNSVKRGFLFRARQGGIAAAVAISVVGLVTLFNGQSQTAQNEIAVIVPESPAVLAQQQFEAQQRLNAYLREHAEQASFTTGHAVVPADLEWFEADTQ